ncbi:MAG: RNA ligase RtcB family protein [Pseudomonas sp.]|uniref:RNA ligase RtcB family protein n=1 Tax=Pseudomonas sp. TaxID=306 RepID=UPI003393B151
MGTVIQNLGERVALIASENTWIEGNAIQQLQHCAQLPGMQRVVGMPDLHPGRGYPVGAAFFSRGHFYPALVGNDIGCGMALWSTDLDSRRLNLDKLEKRLGSIDGPLDADWQSEIDALGLVPSGFERSLGTIGGGNHFAELQQLEQIYDASAVQALGISDRQLLLLVHSGSRGLGQAILRQHVDAFGHAGLEQGSAAADGYLAQHQQALKYAEANRQLIARRMLAQWRSTGAALLDIHHNLVSAARVDGQGGWLHRKGATPADAGPVVIPGSRGDYSYLVRPLPSEVSLLSLAHGAGRKWMRTECKGRLDKRYSPLQLARTALGSRVICADRALIYEEAPEAYKSIDSVIHSLQAAGLIELLARLKPVLTYKTRGECC